MGKAAPEPAGGDGHHLGLRDGLAEVEVSRDGGCILAYRWKTPAGVVDWLRPAPRQGLPAPTDTGCFPLVPYSNRIREARFSFAGRDYRLARNFGASPHSIHGHGWQRPWDVTARENASLTLAYSHDGDDWPSAYRAEQRLALRDGALQLALSLTNDGPAAMPAGLGFHPYFPRTPQCRLSAAVEGMWRTDDEVMPSELIKADLSGGLNPAQTALDNCFTGFAGKAVIDWPERRASLTLTADPALAFLVVFTPPAADFFCVEPVSHSTDAVNLAAARDDTGLRVLQPGESFAAAVTLAPGLGTAA
jgi:aldose 1-epimerase